MKLRIRGNSVRFRLSQTEMVQLAERGAVRDSVEFGPGARLDYRIEVGPVESLQANYAAQSIWVVVPTATARKWARPEEVAVQGEQPVTGDGTLSILLEKDFACLTPREGEDDSAAFPNPGSTGGWDCHPAARLEGAEAQHLRPEIVASAPTTDGVIETLQTLAFEGARVGVQLYGTEWNEKLMSYIHSRDVKPDCVAPYVHASEIDDRQVTDLIGQMHAGEIDAIAFTSKSQVERLKNLARRCGLEQALYTALADMKAAAIDSSCSLLVTRIID